MRKATVALSVDPAVPTLLALDPLRVRQVRVAVVCAVLWCGM